MVGLGINRLILYDGHRTNNSDLNRKEPFMDLSRTGDKGYSHHRLSRSEGFLGFGFLEANPESGHDRE